MNFFIELVASVLSLFILLSIIRLINVSFESNSIKIGLNRFYQNLNSFWNELLYQKLNEPNVYLEAQIELESENLLIAEEYIDQYLFKFEDDKRSLITLIQILILKNKYQQALELIKKILTDLKMRELYNRYGQMDKLLMACLKQLDNVDEAIFYKEEYIKKNPNSISKNVIEKIYRNPQLIKTEITTTYSF